MREDGTLDEISYRRVGVANMNTGKSQHDGYVNLMQCWNFHTRILVFLVSGQHSIVTPNPSMTVM
jgi:hypothetical protein